MQQGKADWNQIGQYEIRAYSLREIVAGDFDFGRVRTAESSLFCRFDNWDVLRLDIDQFGTDGFAGDWIGSTDKPA